MARRRDQTLDGRWLAGEDGDLFVLTDGVDAVFDWHRDEVYDDVDLARVAWERARVRTWQHEAREDVWPPIGAVYDGLVCRTADLGWRAAPERAQSAVEADLADLAAFRKSRPDAAASIAPELAEYERALDLAAGLATRDATEAERRTAWHKINRRGT